MRLRLLKWTKMGAILFVGICLGIEGTSFYFLQQSSSDSPTVDQFPSSSISEQKQYKKAIFFYDGEIPLSWYANYASEAAFGRVAIFNQEDFFNEGQVNWGIVGIERRSGEIIDKIIQNIREKNQNVQWSTKTINNKIFQIAQYPVGDGPSGRRKYFYKWSATAKSDKTYSIGLIATLDYSNGERDPSSTDVEHFLATIDYEKFEDEYLGSIAPFYTDKIRPNDEN